MPRQNLFDDPPADDPRLPGSIGRESERSRIEAAREMFKRHLERQPEGLGPSAGPGEVRPTLRLELFVPYLLVRSAAGDRGGRPPSGPPNLPVSQSPDIWVAKGDPSSNTDPVPTPAPLLAAGGPYTVYAHVWNLGRAPVVGVRVEFYYTDTYPPEGPPPGNLLGLAGADLPPRTSLACHRLIKCPRVLTLEAGRGFELGELTVRVSCIGDPVGKTHPWHPPSDRHVARRTLWSP